MEYTNKILSGVGRKSKETLLNQKGKVLWFTGLPGSGKSTLALALEKEFFNRGLLTQLLDGDIVRKGLCSNLGFTPADREENIRRIAEVSGILCHCGIITLAAFISPTKVIRQMAKDIVGAADFVEIYVSTPLEICEKRDPKGHYAQARAGKLSDFTGISAPYEPPEMPDFAINTTDLSVEESVDRILQKLLFYL